MAQARQPTLHNVHLKLCCQQSLGLIRSKIQLAKWIQRLLPVGVLATLFTDGVSRGSVISTLPSVCWTDWDKLGMAMRAVPDILKEQVRNICEYEELKHEEDNEQQLKQFWEGMEDAFN